MYTYKGYSYRPWDDHEEDNVKTFHDIYATSSDGKQEVYSGSMPMSPYVFVPEYLFRFWIDCGMPTKKEMGLTNNAQTNDIVEYHWKWLDNKIDEMILGG